MSDENRETTRINVKSLINQIERLTNEQVATQRYLQQVLEANAGTRSDVAHINNYIADSRTDMNQLKSDVTILKTITTNVGNFGQEIASLKARMVDGIRDRVTKIESKQEQHKNVLSSLNILENKVLKIEGVFENSDIKKKLDGYDKRLADLDKYGGELESRLQKIETVQETKDKEGTKNSELWKWVIGSIISLIAISPGWWAAVFNQGAQQAIEKKAEESKDKPKDK